MLLSSQDRMNLHDYVGYIVCVMDYLDNVIGTQLCAINRTFVVPRHILGSSPEIPPKITIQSIIDTVVCSSCHHGQEANYGDSSTLFTEVVIVSLATLQYGYMLDHRSDTSFVRA